MNRIKHFRFLSSNIQVLRRNQARMRKVRTIGMTPARRKFLQPEGKSMEACLPNLEICRIRLQDLVARRLAPLSSVTGRQIYSWNVRER